MLHRWPQVFTAALSLLLLAAPPGRADKDQRQPGRFAIIFNMGYATNALPREPEVFEKLVRAIKEAHFNTILCAYDAKRAEVCKKHDVQMFVDLLAEKHHVYKNTEACRKLCESLRNDPTIYGYHLWSDNIAGTAAGRSRDVKNVQEWDGTHPAYVGSYRLSRMSGVEGMDLFGYYDFHWTRGGHWEHLNQAFNLAKARQVPFLRYDAASPGLVGKGNANRAGYTIATSIPFGLKGYMYHYAGGVVNSRTWELDELGKDLQKVNATFAAVGPELMKLHLPTAVYSTPITTDARNHKLDAAAVPAGLSAIPEQSWFKVAAGEILVGVCQDTAKRDVLMLACHNPYRSQEVTLQFRDGVRKAEWFDRAKGRWKELPLADGKARVSVEDYAIELVRVERDASK
jgi:hypothetical protein